MDNIPSGGILCMLVSVDGCVSVCTTMCIVLLCRAHPKVSYIHELLYLSIDLPTHHSINPSSSTIIFMAKVYQQAVILLL